jgi:hypothetical protein
MLMSGVCRQIQSGGRRTVKVSVLRGKGDHIARAVTQISKELHHIRSIAERWSVDQRWTLLLTRLLRLWLGGKSLPGLPDEAARVLSGSNRHCRDTSEQPPSTSPKGAQRLRPFSFFRVMGKSGSAVEENRSSVKRGRGAVEWVKKPLARKNGGPRLKSAAW